MEMNSNKDLRWEKFVIPLMFLIMVIIKGNYKREDEPGSTGKLCRSSNGQETNCCSEDSQAHGLFRT